MVGVLPIRIVWSNVSSIGFSKGGPMLETIVRLYYPYWQYTNHFILAKERWTKNGQNDILIMTNSL